MERLNFDHLFYFWVVAREGSIVAASRELRLAPSTISSQIHRLEELLEQKLFVRKGRNLELTEAGQIALHYGEEIFALGREFLDTLQGRGNGQPLRLTVGISEILPKSIVHRILSPAFSLKQPVKIICREDSTPDVFLAELVKHEIDAVLSDAPVSPSTPVRAHSHLLGECGTSFFAVPRLAEMCRQDFPRSLDRVPFLLPGGNSMFRRILDEWFHSQGIQVKAIAELDDAALVQVLGEGGRGVFAVPDVVADDVQLRYNVELISHVETLRQRFYVISVERKLKHPAVAAICEVARRHIFA